jgi:hypothetical protein
MFTSSTPAVLLGSALCFSNISLHVPFMQPKAKCLSGLGRAPSLAGDRGIGKELNCGTHSVKDDFQESMNQKEVFLWRGRFGGSGRETEAS